MRASAVKRKVCLWGEMSPFLRPYPASAVAISRHLSYLEEKHHQAIQGKSSLPTHVHNLAAAALVPSELIQINNSDDVGCDRVKKQSYVPMPTIHTHWEHSSRVWQQPIKSQDLLNSLTSPLTGHTSTAMFSRGGECLFFLGGGTQTENRSYR